VNADFIAGLQTAGLTPADAKLVAKKFAEFGYALTKEYKPPGTNLAQSDNDYHFLVSLLRKHSPFKRLPSHADVFRSLARDGYYVVLPKVYPV
jgi:hypothetical protein